MRGFYNDWGMVLDYASLYPSIMISHNLCYSTLLSAEQLVHYRQLHPDWRLK